MTDDPVASFYEERRRRIADYEGSPAAQSAHRFMIESFKVRYSYNFDWLSRPIIQYPSDIVAIQELIWKTRPDLIIETGIAHGGSAILSASILALLDYCDAVAAGAVLDPRKPQRRVLAIDIDIRPHNRRLIEQHPLSNRIDLIEGSSIDPKIVQKVKAAAANRERTLVCLDSNHTHDHVLAELQAYAPLVSVGSYCVVFDTVIDRMPAELLSDRPWGPNNNPRTAVQEFIGTHPGFVIDEQIDSKLLVSVAPEGYLRRIS